MYDLCRNDILCFDITSVFCFFVDLNHVPSGLPIDIVKMDLSGNSITHLKPQQFLTCKDLKLLNLSRNSLQQIETGEKPPG